MTLQSLAERLKLIEPKPRVNFAAATPRPMTSYPSYDLSGIASQTGPWYRIPQRQDLLLLARLRELIPLLDMAIVWLRLLIGTPMIEADDAVRDELMLWLAQLNVNRVQTGFNLWLPCHIDNALMYGRTHAEIIPTNRRDDVFGLVEVAPLTTALRPQPDRYHLDVIQHAHAGEPILLNPELLVTTVFDVRGDDPQGTSLLFGIPFVAEMYAKMVKRLGSSWDRFGDPSMFCFWEPPDTLDDPTGATTRLVGDSVRAQIEDIERARANGQTKNLVAAGKFNIGVLGAQGEVMEFSITAQSLMEQICAKTRLPPFLFGLQWATTERMSTTQAILLNEVIESYQAGLNPGVLELFKLRQRLAGKSDDIKLSWSHTSLQDRMEEARAKQMEAVAQQVDIDNQLSLGRMGVYSIEEFAQHFRPELAGLTPADVRRKLPKLARDWPEEVPTAAPFGAGLGMPAAGPSEPTGTGARGNGNGNGRGH